MSARPCPARLSAQAGFSLLEVLVAFSIMALALGALYQSAGGSVRGAIEAERQARAIFLAQSLLALHQSVPVVGVSEQGDFEDLQWNVSSERFPLPGDPPPPVQLQRLVAAIGWVDRGRARSLVLSTIVPERMGEP